MAATRGSEGPRSVFERNLIVAGFPWMPGPGSLDAHAGAPTLPTIVAAAPMATATGDPTVTPPAHADDARAAAIRGLLAGRPLAAFAELMVATADAHGIDWRLLPVIALLESGGGVQACGGNAWGYAACRASFASFDEGIRVVAALLASPPYSLMSTSGLLCMWVSGSGCNSQWAVDYAYRAAGVYSQLGGWFALPARIQAPADDGAATAGESGVSALPAPSASPTSTASRSAITTPSATASPTVAPSRTAATPAPTEAATPPATSAPPTSTPAPSATIVPEGSPAAAP